jgi:hypothetical protein
VLVAGPLVAWIIGALAGAEAVSGVSVLGAGLRGIGLPEICLSQYDIALNANQVLLMVHGTEDQAERAREIVKLTHPVDWHNYPLRRLGAVA